MPDFPITINSQEDFDNQIQQRLTRERQKWERESGHTQELDQARARVAELEGNIRTRDARSVLTGMNVTDQKRQDRIIKLAEIPDEADDKALAGAFKSLYDEMPEVFGEGAAVKEKALDTTQGGGDSGAAEGPLTREKVESMSPEQINSNWDRVKAFISGER